MEGWLRRRHGFWVRGRHLTPLLLLLQHPFLHMCSYAQPDYSFETMISLVLANMVDCEVQHVRTPNGGGTSGPLRIDLKREYHNSVMAAYSDKEALDAYQRMVSSHGWTSGPRANNAAAAARPLPAPLPPAPPGPAPRPRPPPRQADGLPCPAGAASSSGAGLKRSLPPAPDADVAGKVRKVACAAEVILIDDEDDKDDENASLRQMLKEQARKLAAAEKAVAASAAAAKAAAASLAQIAAGPSSSAASSGFAALEPSR